MDEFALADSGKLLIQRCTPHSPALLYRMGWSKRSVNRPKLNQSGCRFWSGGKGVFGMRHVQPNILQLIENMQNCLGNLDQIGAGMAAAHLDMAIHTLRNQFDLKEIHSISDPSGRPVFPCTCYLLFQA